MRTGQNWGALKTRTSAFQQPLYLGLVILDTELAYGDCAKPKDPSTPSQAHIRVSAATESLCWDTVPLLQAPHTLSSVCTWRRWRNVGHWQEVWLVVIQPACTGIRLDGHLHPSTPAPLPWVSATQATLLLKGGQGRPPCHWPLFGKISLDWTRWYLQKMKRYAICLEAFAGIAHGISQDERKVLTMAGQASFPGEGCET